MLKAVRNFLILSLAVLSFSVVGVNAQNYSGLKSSSIERNVYKEIIKLPRYEVFDHISFQVDNSGTVTLYGKVFNGINKSSAANVVKHISGVTNVVNKIEILPPSSFDDQIRVSVYQRLNNTGGLSRYFWEANPSVRIIVDNGHVALEGFVANRGDYNTMNIIANTVSGVFDVKNNLVVESEMVK